MKRLNIKNYKNVDRNNSYFEFIENCKAKIYPKGEPMHVHHIIPAYVFNKTEDPEHKGFQDSSDNLIKLSLEDHIRAHELLYEIYGNPKDLGAVQCLNGQFSEAAQMWKRAGAEASHEIQKQNQKNLWNHDFQKEMAFRSMQRPDALEIRSKGGKKGGRTTKLNKAIKAHERYTFSFEGKEVISIINCQSGTEVVKILQALHPTKLSRVTGLLKSTRKYLHGWSCVKHESGPYHSPENLAKLTNQYLSME